MSSAKVCLPKISFQLLGTFCNLIISSSRAVFHLSNDNVCNKDVLPVLIGHVSRHIIRLAIVIPGNARPCFFFIRPVQAADNGRGQFGWSGWAVWLMWYRKAASTHNEMDAAFLFFWMILHFFDIKAVHILIFFNTLLSIISVIPLSSCPSNIVVYGPSQTYSPSNRLGVP